MNSSVAWIILSAAYREHAPVLIRHCAMKTRSTSEAEEIVQDTFIHVYNYLQDGNVVDNMKVFLFSVSNNLVIDRARVKNRRKEREVRFDELYIGDDDDGAMGSDDPVHRMHRRLMTQHLLEACRSELVTVNYELLQLRYLHGLKPGEIAKRKGMTSNAVSLRLRRAIKHLGTMLPKKP